MPAAPVRHCASVLRITYRDQAGILRQVLSRCTQQGYTVAELSRGLVAGLTEIDGVLGIRVREPDEGE
jgi:hypothetical protein